MHKGLAVLAVFTFCQAFRKFWPLRVHVSARARVFVCSASHEVFIELWAALSSCGCVPWCRSCSSRGALCFSSSPNCYLSTSV